MEAVQDRRIPTIHETIIDKCAKLVRDHGRGGNLIVHLHPADQARLIYEQQGAARYVNAPAGGFTDLEIMTPGGAAKIITDIGQEQGRFLLRSDTVQYTFPLPREKCVCDDWPCEEWVSNHHPDCPKNPNAPETVRNPDYSSLDTTEARALANEDFARWMAKRRGD